MPQEIEEKLECNLLITPSVHTRIGIIKAKFKLKSLSDALKFLLDYYEGNKLKNIKDIDLD